ncbi:hypothetical protein O1611_g4358 [Lasiodiplodia mahajangana]|uniref:Uncharacterized protein n=1 Tax=Lasiodiplodia mahajangana TaxID=1108764 RepID=A0ACC2JP58_9PEZI|nr:hypothetical protein O1611_g4358 [Lasiodiplodia mahajangana]
MDPLSVAGSIAGLVTIADALFRGVYKYYRTASDASHEIEDLVNRLQSLAGVLHSLKILADALEQDGTQTTIQMTHILNATKLLGEIKERLDKSQSKRSGSKIDAIQQSLKWPFTKTKTKELSEKLSQQQEIISLALHSDSLSNLVKLLSDSKDIKTQLSSVQQGVQNLQELTRVKVDIERQRILDFFLKVNPQPNLDTSIKLRHPGTGNWLTDSPQFQQWIETAGSNIWLSGIPGAGKTVLAGAVIQKALEKGKNSLKVGITFFFCDYKDPKATIASNMLGAMASQLARQNDQAFDELKKLFESLHPEDGLAREPNSDILQDCLEEMFKCFDQIIIVVDGLDECGDNTDEVTRALANMADYSINVSMALASRDEYNIERKLRESFTKIQVGARKEDILLYVGSEIDRRIEDGRLRITNVTLKDEILTTLSTKADGMFRWVTCQLDYLRDCPSDADRRTALSELPPTLYATYERILRRINRGNPRGRRVVQKCLQLISVDHMNLTIDQLRRAVSVPDAVNATLPQDSIIDEEEISRLCSSFIRKSEDGSCFEFSHFTVREFLEREALLRDHDLAGYYLSGATCNATLAQQCLRYLQLREFYHIPEMDKDSQAQHALEIFQDAAAHRWATFEWLYALRHAPQDPTCLELMKSLFHPRKTSAFTLWATYFIADQKLEGERPDLDDLTRAAALVLDPTFRTIHVAAALDLPEICKHLVEVDIKWNTVSAIGSPLECSIGRLPTLLDKPIQASYEIFSIRDTFELVLYATHRPGQSTVLLGTAGSKIQYPLRRFGEWSLMMCAMFFSAGSLDFSPVCSLICMGWVVSDEEAATFEESMACVAQSYPDGYYNGPHTSRERLTASFLDLIGSLNGFRIANTDPGFRVCITAWNTAVKLGCDFTEDITLMDTRVTLSLGALGGKCKLAILKDDVESMQKYLEDGRITGPETDYDSTEGSGYYLLDHAIKNESAKILALLVSRGYDLNKPLPSGNLPIHSALEYGEDTLRFLLESGASHLSRDTDGQNIWHIAAFAFEHGTLSSLLKLAGDTKISALQAQDNDGYTPLTLAIEEAMKETDEDFTEDIATTVSLLLDVSGADPLCWRCAGSPWDLVARYGSAAAVKCLAESGVPLDPINDGQSTPLHVLSEKASKECAELLIELFPTAKDLQHEGRTPMERFIYWCLLQEIVPQEGVVESFVYDDVRTGMIQKKSFLWKHFCTDIVGSKSLEYSENRSTVFDTIIQKLFHMDIIEAYEELNGHSASLPLFGGLSNSRFVGGILPGHRRELISRTKFWASACLGKETIGYVNHLIGYMARDTIHRAANPGWAGTIIPFLDNGVDVHVHSGSSSILIKACQAFECGHRDGATAEPITFIHEAQRSVFEAIVDRVNPDQLNKTKESANECLKRLLAKGDHSGSSWMLEKLVTRGLDPNKPRLAPDGDPLLVHCLWNQATSAAMMLLKLGADPTATGRGDFNALHAAAYHGCLEFIRSLLNKLGEKSMLSLSQKIGNLDLQLEKANTTFPMNALHLASYTGQVECLRFFLDNGLVSNAEYAARGYNCLHFAAIKGHSETSENLCSLGLDVNNPANDGSLPIHFAVRNGHASAVKALLKCGSSARADGFGMTPQMYATKLGYNKILEILDESKPSSESHTAAGESQGREARPKLLLMALESAIETEDMETLERLYNQGCPLDISMPNCDGCSPLIVAIRTRKVAVVQWLLTKRCSVLRVSCRRHGRKAALALAVQGRALTSHLSEILDIGLETAWDLASLGYPLHAAVTGRIHENLRLVIEHIKQNIEKYSLITGNSQENLLEKMVNERGASGDSLLHLAAYNGDLEILETLLDAGADVDALDFAKLTPIQETRHRNIIVRLLAAGSKYGWFDSASWANLATFDWQYFEDIQELIVDQIPHRWTANLRNLPGPIENCFPRPEPIDLGPKLLSSLLQQGVDLNQPNCSQVSFMHRALCCYKSTSYLLNLPQIFDCRPFPWHATGCQLDDLSWMNTCWKLFKRRIPFVDLQRIMNLHPEQGISPLCQAAAIDELEIVDHCLEMGASIDFDGSSYGSALMAACANRRLKAVKHLVRRGASITYCGELGVMSAIEMANGHKKIIAWLLVGQFIEQPKLEYPIYQDPNGVRLLRPWSGILQKPMRLVGGRARQPDESLHDQILYLAVVRDAMRGKALPLHQRDPLEGLSNVVCYQI